MEGRLSRTNNLIDDHDLKVDPYFTKKTSVVVLLLNFIF
jgi:hypothetical protein